MALEGSRGHSLPILSPFISRLCGHVETCKRVRPRGRGLQVKGQRRWAQMDGRGFPQMLDSMISFSFFAPAFVFGSSTGASSVAVCWENQHRVSKSTWVWQNQAGRPSPPFIQGVLLSDSPALTNTRPLYRQFTPQYGQNVTSCS